MLCGTWKQEVIMAKLTVTIDTDDMFGDGYNADSFCSFESLIKQALTAEVKKDMTEIYSKEVISETSRAIALEVVDQIETKLASLINEEMVITNRWGKPEFIGTVEDYIKKEIDEHLTHPVDHKGKKIKGCPKEDANTWLQYHVKNEVKNNFTIINKELRLLNDRYCRQVIDDKIHKFKTEGLNALLIERLKAAGIS
jgi:hypothetical protein